MKRIWSTSLLILSYTLFTKISQPIERPYVSMTLQTAPGIPSKDNRPYVMTIPEWGFNWYKNLSYGHNVSINPFFYGTYLGGK